MRRPEILLFLIAAASPLSFATWHALLNNFAIDKASFDAFEMGVLQSVREIPGFLSFTAVFLLLFIREQRFAMVALILLGVGTAATGIFPSFTGLLATTVIMSIGFHYFETLNQSLALQWLDKARAPIVLGRLLAVTSFVGLVVYGLIAVSDKVLGLSYLVIYAVAGGLTVAIALYCLIAFPMFPEKNRQHKTLILRKRYWLYYVLTFFSGARRQIFVVFAGFMLVEKFGYTLGEISLLFLINGAITMIAAPFIGKLISHWGERRALVLEYIGLIVIFTSYAFVENAMAAAVLFILDHVFFAMAIAMKTYFQKIADPQDIASTAGVSFTISHIAAVVIPAAFGLLYVVSPAAVFLAGAGMAGMSLYFALMVPRHPEPGNEIHLKNRAPAVAAE